MSGVCMEMLCSSFSPLLFICCSCIKICFTINFSSLNMLSHIATASCAARDVKTYADTHAANTLVV